MLAGCGSGDQGSGNAPDAALSAGEASDAGASSNVAEAAAAGIDKPSIQANLAYLTGASPAPLADGETTISDRASEDGRRAAAGYMKESFEAMGIPTHILEFTSGNRRGFNVEATLQGIEGNVGSAVSAIRDQEGQGAIIGNLHSDMIGYNGGGLDAVMRTCSRAGPIDEAVSRASRRIDSPVNLSKDCLGRSDHQNFWEAGLSAAVMTDGAKYDGYPWYHEPGDTMDKLNVPYLRYVIQLNAATAALRAADRDSLASQSPARGLFTLRRNRKSVDCKTRHTAEPSDPRSQVRGTCK